MSHRYLLAPALTAALLLAESAAAADTELGNFGVASMFFAMGAALLAILFCRPLAKRALDGARELRGSQRLRAVLGGHSKHVLSDFLLPGAYGGLTKIDCALLTGGGILCLRVKHCGGTVYGDAAEPQWTHAEGAANRRFLNPLIQNEGRLRALQRALPDVPVASVVVFTGKVRFASARQPNVITVDELDSFIRKFVFGPCKIEDWDAVWLSLKSAALTDEDSRKDFSAQLSFS